MAKIITDKLITDKLEAKGYLEYHDMDETKAWNLLEKHYNCEVSDQWTNKHFEFLLLWRNNCRWIYSLYSY